MYVSKDIPSYAVAVGNPCRIVKYRFDDEMIELLNKFQWWNKSEEEITKIMPILTNPNLDEVIKYLRKDLCY